MHPVKYPSPYICCHSDCKTLKMWDKVPFSSGISCHSWHASAKGSCNKWCHSWRANLWSWFETLILIYPSKKCWWYIVIQFSQKEEVKDIKRGGNRVQSSHRHPCPGSILHSWWQCESKGRHSPGTRLGKRQRCSQYSTLTAQHKSLQRLWALESILIITQKSIVLPILASVNFEAFHILCFYGIQIGPVDLCCQATRFHNALVVGNCTWPQIFNMNSLVDFHRIPSFSGSPDFLPFCNKVIHAFLGETLISAAGWLQWMPEMLTESPNRSHGLLDWFEKNLVLTGYTVVSTKKIFGTTLKWTSRERRFLTA